MKLLSYITVVLAMLSSAHAQSISNQELQERFNKAFSVFNKQSNTTEKDLSEISKDEKAHSEKAEKTLEFNKGDKNIVKKSNSIEQKSTHSDMKTEEFDIPKTQNIEMLNARSFVDIKERPVLVDMQNATLKQIVQETLNQVAQGEQWTIKWRLKDENKYILIERMNLTAEVSFDAFIGNMLKTVTNITGIRLTTKVFNKNRVIIITDSY